MIFFVGLHDPHTAGRFERCMISANRLRSRNGRNARKTDFAVNDWLMDSGAFTEITTHGEYRSDPAEYAEMIRRWSRCGNLLAAVSQDYMCEPFVLERTGMTINDHQRLTVERYVAISELVGNAANVMPVLQGYEPREYAEHIRMYGNLLRHGQWVGVGSVCKRNSNASSIEDVLYAIRAVRPDLRLHGFGIKITALQSAYVQANFYSADSMAWSFSARKKGRNGNDPVEAQNFIDRINAIRPAQHHLFASIGQ